MKFNRRIFFTLAAMAAFAPMAIDLYLPSLPQMAAHFGTSADDVQRTLSVFLLGFAAGMLVYGPLSDRFGRRQLILQGIGLFVFASVACALAQSVEQLLLFRALQALGGGAAGALSRAIVKDLAEPVAAARVMATIGLVTSLAPLLAPILGGVLLTFAGWRLEFWALALFGVLTWLSVYFFVPETRYSHPGPTSLAKAFGAYGQMLAKPQAVALLMAGGAGFAAMFAYITGTPFVYIEYYGIDPQVYGFLFGVNVFAIMAGGFTTSRFVSRFGPRRLQFVGGCLTMAGALIVGLSVLDAPNRFWVLILGLLLVVGAIGFLSSNCVAVLMGMFPNNAGAASALFGSMQFGLGALASWGVSYLHDQTPAAMAKVILVFSVLSFTGAVMARRSP